MPAVRRDATLALFRTSQQNMTHRERATPFIVPPIVVMDIPAATSGGLAVTERKKRCLAREKFPAGNAPHCDTGIVRMPDRDRVIGLAG